MTAEVRPSAPIRVLAADDSAVMRGVYRRLFGMGAQSPRLGERSIELCGIVEDGVACLEAVSSLRPDVVVLDVEMPRMHGLEVLSRLREREPQLPVILCSSSTEAGARVTLEALAMGALDYVTKPGTWTRAATAMDSLGEQLLRKIAVLGQRRSTGSAEEAHLGRTSDRDCADECGSAEVIVIGISTGGPSALETLLPSLPAGFPVPVLIAQHMPKLFTGALADRLDRCCALRVREAYDGAELEPGSVWLAPGDAHMAVAEEDSSLGARACVVRLSREGKRSFCTPSVDVLFRSAACTYGAGTLALVMTGMGADGLAGARAVYEAGGTVLAQDEATSAVWGMPGRAFEAGIVRRLLPLERIAGELMLRVSPAAAGLEYGRAHGLH